MLEQKVEKHEISDKSFQVILTIYMQMIIDNENEKLPRNTKTRMDRRNKINNEKKLLLNKIKSEKKEI